MFGFYFSEAEQNNVRVKYSLCKIGMGKLVARREATSVSEWFFESVLSECFKTEEFSCYTLNRNHRRKYLYMCWKGKIAIKGLFLARSKYLMCCDELKAVSFYLFVSLIF